MSVVGNRKIDIEVAAAMLQNGATVREVADAFRVSTQAVYRAIHAGRIPTEASSPQDAATLRRVHELQARRTARSNNVDAPHGTFAQRVRNEVSCVMAEYDVKTWRESLNHQGRVPARDA